ncbi:hypothetical protein THAOC_19169, partial [Thalassiosira oceanica]
LEDRRQRGATETTGRDAATGCPRRLEGCASVLRLHRRLVPVSGRPLPNPSARDDDLRGVRARAARGRVQRGSAGAQAEHQEVRGVHRCWESAGADEEGSHEVGGGRLPNLQPAFAAWTQANRLSGLLHEGSTLAMVQKRVDAGDPAAIWNLGQQYCFGLLGLEKDVTRAVELLERAAELGVKEAHFSLGCLYDEGTDAEEDIARSIRHWEAAAMCGHVSARFNLGCGEDDAGNYDLALQHWMIASKMGHEMSLDCVKAMFMRGLATKADYAGALRGYQSAVEEMRSPDRDEASALGLDNILSM